ncbi:pitrilysin family protein [Sphaerisporangium rubeum]|uniref:Putative Zn-dependent peptidase n=1 Tax=Sphaerisporangium rubeum TaxID=321317 RepID=A0A7X0MA95_9ACTN|nr:pitrilysin family protein [Sphaerisporangium rubeum]MBB6475761.1 putative Zn-dependent peptidase [Sphaerisporangium rubeum]
MREPERAALDNGVPVWVLRRPGATATSVTTWLLTGSRYEPERVAGGTHLLEHILMQAPLPEGRPVDLLEGLGGEANAITSRDHLVLYARVPSPEAPAALEILGRALATPSLTEDVLEAERKVVQEELRLAAGDPFDIVHDVFYDVAFSGHPLARPVGGTAESVENVGLADLRAFHEQWVRAGSAGVIVCGDMTTEAVLAVLSAGPLASLPPAAAAAGHGTPRVSGGRRDLALNNDSAGVVLGGPAVPYGHPLLPAWQVLMDLVAGASSALLFEEIRNRRGLAYEMWGFTNAYRDTGVWRAFVATAPEHAEEVVALGTSLLRERAERGWSAEEVEVATRRTAGLLQLETEQSLEEALLYGRYGLIPGHPSWTLAGQVAAIRAVTADDVLSCLRMAIDPMIVSVAGVE